MQSAEEFAFQAKIPKLAELAVIEFKLDPKEIRDRSVKSDFQWKKLKCRVIIFSFPNVLTSPLLGVINSVQVIVSKDFYCKEKMTSLERELRLEESNVYTVTRDKFEMCLRYTLVTRLAPHWNIVDTILVEGRDFLETSGDLNSLQLYISTKDEKMNFCVKVFKCWLPKITMDDIISNNNNLMPNEHQRVHVFPSLKTGKVLSVGPIIPKSACFKNYQEIRRHWKNMHGYRLNKEGGQTIYVNINFFGKDNFLYPLQCLSHSEPFLKYNPDQKKVLDRFMSVIGSRFSFVCDTKLNLILNDPNLSPINSGQASFSNNNIVKNEDDEPNTQDISFDTQCSSAEKQTESSANLSCSLFVTNHSGDIFSDSKPEGSIGLEQNKSEDSFESE